MMRTQKHQGLSDSEVLSRIKDGKVNVSEQKISKSYKRIFYDNIFSFFNLINVILLILVFSVGSFKNGLFGFTIIINTGIGIYQEIKAKRTLDRLTLLVSNDVSVIRNGEVTTLMGDQLVIDDLIVMKPGNQIPADAVVIDGEAEVNESMLTGESDAVLKKIGDELFSGSFVVSGSVTCRLINVGENNWAQKLTNEARVFKKHYSELSNNLDKILKLVSIFVVPAGILLFLKQMYLMKMGYQNAILDTVAAVLGMIPEGLILLTSTALIIGIVRLAKMHTLVQELTCIETLARVDVLCLDKTGTLTEGKIVFNEIIKLMEFDEKYVIGNLLGSMVDSNVTMDALREVYSLDSNNYLTIDVLPFSSKKKYCAVSFRDKGCYFLGAKQSLFPNGHPLLDELCEEEASNGKRLLVLACSSKNDISTIVGLEPLAVILLAESVRDDVKETLDYFRKQGVELKIISGDDAITVSAIAAKAGLENAKSYVDVSTLGDDSLFEAARDYSIFGRVTPHQKKQLIINLKKQGRTVAMTGDGVNDVLAFKEADCSIAMISGCDAAKRTANIVLLDNGFASMPHIVNEGRRVINNIMMASSMYLIKTFFSVLLTGGTLLISINYPFEPIQLTLISACCVGVPTFLLTYEPNFEKASDDFFRRVITYSLPSSILIATMSLGVMGGGQIFDIPDTILASICVLLTGWVYFLALIKIYTPLTKYRKLVIFSLQAIYYFTFSIFGKMLGVTIMLPGEVIVLLLVIAILVPFLLYLLGYLVNLTAASGRKI